MINKKILIILLALGLFTSCKKTYQCQCSNANGVYDAGETDGTKRQARKHCQSLSGGSTTCDIK